MFSDCFIFVFLSLFIYIYIYVPRREAFGSAMHYCSLFRLPNNCFSQPSIRRWQILKKEFNVLYGLLRFLCYLLKV